jgi:LacI family transcriptional regulator
VPRNEVRLADVAAAAGVSPSTASRVLSEAAEWSVSPRTRARVLAVATELGYGAERAAGIRRTGTIGLIGEGLAAAPILAGIVLGAQEAVNRRGDVLLIMAVSEFLDGAGDGRSKITSLLDGHVDGVLFVAPSHRHVKLPVELDGHPVVVLNGRSDDAGTSWVTPAEEAGGWDAAAALISVGHTRLAYLNSDDGNVAAEQRARGFRERAGVAGLDESSVTVVHARPSVVGGYEAACELLASADRPTALACFDVRTAMGVYRAAAELGLSVPGELSVIAFDDDDYLAQSLHPALTTLALPSRAMATWAVEHLYSRMGDPTVEAATASLRCPLVTRDSVAPPPG